MMMSNLQIEPPGKLISTRIETGKAGNYLITVTYDEGTIISMNVCQDGHTNVSLNKKFVINEDGVMHILKN